MKKGATIPTFLAIVILLVVLVLLTLGRDQAAKLFSKASVGTTRVSNVEISNISDKGWTVSWTSSVPATGVVYFGTNELTADGVAPDVRDVDGQPGKFLTHYVSVFNVRSGTYFFRIGSGDEKLGSDGITPYAVLIPTPLGDSSKLDPVYGKVLQPTGHVANGAILTFTAAGSQTLSALTSAAGEFVLPVNTLRTVDLRKLLEAKDGTIEQLKVIGAENLVSVVQCRSGYDRPIPTITLGKNLNCIEQFPPTLPATTPSSQSGSSRLPTSRFSPVLNLMDGEKLDQLPTFSGKAGPSQQVTIQVHSTTVITALVKADSTGKWSWTPPSNLPPGEHTVTITVVNPDGTKDVITRKFVVFTDNNLLPSTSGEKVASTTAQPLVSP